MSDLEIKRIESLRLDKDYLINVLGIDQVNPKIIALERYLDLIGKSEEPGTDIFEILRQTDLKDFARIHQEEIGWKWLFGKCISDQLGWSRYLDSQDQDVVAKKLIETGMDKTYLEQYRGHYNNDLLRRILDPSEYKQINPFRILGYSDQEFIENAIKSKHSMRISQCIQNHILGPSNLDLVLKSGSIDFITDCLHFQEIPEQVLDSNWTILAQNKRFLEQTLDRQKLSPGFIKSHWNDIKADKGIMGCLVAGRNGDAGGLGREILESLLECGMSIEFMSCFYPFDDDFVTDHWKELSSGSGVLRILKKSKISDKVITKYWRIFEPWMKEGIGPDLKLSTEFIKAHWTELNLSIILPEMKYDISVLGSRRKKEKFIRIMEKKYTSS